LTNLAEGGRNYGGKERPVREGEILPLPSPPKNCPSPLSSLLRLHHGLSSICSLLLPPICNSLKFNINCTAISRDSLSSLTPLPCPIFSSFFVALPRPHLIRYQNKTGCNPYRRTGITIINRRSIDVESSFSEEDGKLYSFDDKGQSHRGLHTPTRTMDPASLSAIRQEISKFKVSRVNPDFTFWRFRGSNHRPDSILPYHNGRPTMPQVSLPSL